MKIIYWVATGLMCLLMLVSASFYVFGHEQVVPIFLSLGYPAYIIYPLAIAKILGVIAIITGRSRFLKEWAYAGFFFDFVLAASAHLNAGDGGYLTALVALVLLGVSRFTWDDKV